MLLDLGDRVAGVVERLTAAGVGKMSLARLSVPSARRSR
jgi:hypothetical protein